MSLENLYREIILDHYKHPRKRGTLEGPGVLAVELKNPSCGDRITLYVRREDDRLAAVRFVGEGCSISMSSASMMSALVEGKTADEAEALAQAFFRLVQGEPLDPATEEALGDAVALQGVHQFPVRIKCATLAWKALERALAEGGAAAESPAGTPAP
ncbi:Fe-S cluster assembly sulfur transfer protein SufU [Hydrogenibacillus sp. N12]|uniref:Fe-S cluster assembly sulfur transfer protein SufU n=1 Tax=Hydrogenibacillus sp. N12 TaxID=2866627 RepID=UPI001A0208AF|nr:SUF system NifU family Fe-S cluster assembly protein [Hydrogenibacillus sp. N12]MBE3562483.1 SUF system NifU family Fe-S cluster assembly protein [Hydrogenibacillus schlegelii]QZA32731.1 SUF system NifU family Fe-S cluster assembly protein [Hydrogenibacillus sp. N12]